MVKINHHLEGYKRKINETTPFSILHSTLYYPEVSTLITFLIISYSVYLYTPNKFSITSISQLICLGIIY